MSSESVNTDKKFIIASTGLVKLKVAGYIQSVLSNLISGYSSELVSINCCDLKLPEQPFGTNSTFRCCKARLNYIKKKYINNSDNVYISIENGIRVKDREFKTMKEFLEYKFCEGDITEDICVLMIEINGILAYDKSFAIPFDKKYLQQLQKEDKVFVEKRIMGFTETIGKLINSDLGIDSKNWMLELNKIDRYDQIMDAYKNAMNNYNDTAITIKKLKDAYEVYKDWPIDGVNFEDIFTVLKDGRLLKLMINLFRDRYKYDDFDYVIGLESRGLMLGFALAYSFDEDIGFIPIRKEGKLPGDSKVKYSFNKEYGKDTVEMSSNIQIHSKVLLIDDLIALGGSINAGKILIDLVECDIVDIAVLKEVKGILAHKQLEGLYSVLLKD